MAAAIVILGGIGLFLLGMTVITDNMKALAGSALRTVLGKAAATPLSGAFWGAVVILLVQSSSAVTMTTISLVSARLLTFPQGLGLVFGANVGTTGTGWLVAMTAVIQSSTSAIAVTVSAFYAGAVSLEQGAALIIGQNMGTATSSALAAIGAGTTASASLSPMCCSRP